MTAPSDNSKSNPQNFQKQAQDKELRQLEDHLVESGDHYKHLYEFAPNGYIFLDETGAVRQANLSAESLCGMAREQFIGKPLEMLVAIEDRNACCELLLKAKTVGEARDGDFRLARPDGKVLWVNANVIPVLGAVGLPGGFRVAFADITRHKLTEKTQLQSEEQFRAFFENAGVGTAQIDPGLHFIRVNDRFCQITGYSREELLQMTPLDLGHPDYHESDRKWLANAFKQSDFDYNMEKRYLRKDGRVIWVHVTIGPERDDAGTPVRSAAIIEDITARKEAEAELQRNEAVFKTFISESRDGIIIMDRQGRIVEWNTGEEQITGIPRSEAIGRFLWDIQYRLAPSEIRTPAILEMAKEKIRLGLKEGTFLKRTTEERIERPDGTRCIVQANIFAIRIGGELLACGITRDITRRREDEKALERYRDELEAKVAERTAEAEQRAEALRQLALELSGAEDLERRRIAMILHDDLQQYLAAIRFRLGSLLPAELADPKTAQRISTVESLIDESIQKCRSLSHELSPPVLHQNGLISALRWLTQDMNEKHGLQVDLRAEPDAEPASPRLASALFRSIRELLFNIVKHAGTDSAEIHVNAEDGLILIRVSDPGKGFDVHQMRSKQAGKGGFGLFNVEERIRFLGGAFHIQSVPGEGTRIDISLPNKQAQPRKLGELKIDLLGRRGQECGRAPLENTGKIRILITDDHAVMRDGLTGILRNQSDLEVVAQAQNGIEAVRMTDQAAPDVILMDITMPEMDGIAATEQILKKHPCVRIIGLSMHDDPSIEERMRRAGACDYIYKAAPSDELLQSIRMSVIR